MKQQSIIMLCQQSWDISIATSAKNLAQELSKDTQVLYVNMPLDINTVVRGLGQLGVKDRLRTFFGQRDSLVQAQPNVWVLTPRVISLSISWLSPGSVFNAFNRWNSELLASSIRKAVKAIGFDSYHLLQDGIIYQGLELKSLLKPLTSVYYLRDFTLAVPYFQRHGHWVEAKLIQQADAVLTNSTYLNDYAIQHNPNSHNIGQGCALSMYQAEADYALPTDLAALPRPLIGYTGFLTSLRLDANLLLAIAQQRPEWNLVLVGPEDEDFCRSALHEMPNVFFLGSKSPDQLSTYLHYFDVCINPQIVNNITIGNYPLKIDEYLAMGKPTVATATQAMETFADHVCLATGVEEWLTQLESALADHDPQKRAARIAFARSHTWAACVQKLYAATNILHSV